MPPDPPLECRYNAAIAAKASMATGCPPLSKILATPLRMHRRMSLQWGLGLHSRMSLQWGLECTVESSLLWELECTVDMSLADEEA